AKAYGKPALCSAHIGNGMRSRGIQPN
ncbi:MAG: hypothetical protein QOE41_139, partial [Mycobacterium sp.]|nr:hypothetical protein [Mycobacterium sp.]